MMTCEPTLVAIRMPERGYAQPRVNVELSIGPLTVDVVLVRQRRGRILLRWPEADGGAPGGRCSAQTQAVIEGMVREAVEAHPEASAAIFGTPMQVAEHAARRAEGRR